MQRLNLEPLVHTYLGPVLPYLQDVAEYINSSCSHLVAWQIILITAIATIISVHIYQFLFQEEPLLRRAKLSFFRLVKRIPYVKRRIQQELEKTKSELMQTFSKDIKDGYLGTLPPTGWTREKILEELSKYKALGKLDWSGGMISGGVFDCDEAHTELMTKVYGEFAWTNPLHADVFPEIRKMEAEVVRMTCNLFSGGPETCGTMTSGGTESIMLACKAYRDRALDRGIKRPEMLVPHTVHAAFDKAADHFNIKITHIPVDEATRKVSVRAMRKAINKNTCMLVGSAPAYPHGMIDPISEIAQLGMDYGVPVHVDACLGGFLIPFMKKAGFPVEAFDFSLPGVTSISADTHKFGYAPKGTSVIMYRDTSYRQWQYFVAPDWSGGIYAVPTLAGSRPGVTIAGCWATLVYFGEDGYVRATRDVVNTLHRCVEGLRQIEGIFVYGDPQVCVLGIGSLDFDIYRLFDALTAEGWHLNALQFPSSINFMLTKIHTQSGVIDSFLSCVRKAVAEIMKDPKVPVTGQAAVYGMAQTIPDRSLVGEIASSFWDAYYHTEKTGNMTN